MDSCWERSYPLIEMNPKELKEVFSSSVLEVKPISIGCRNSNYIISTKEDRYFLRICVDNPTNEIIVSKAMHEIVKTPKLLNAGTVNDKNYILYEYIEGYTLQGYLMNDDIVRKSAKNAALIHQVDVNRISDFKQIEYPPYATWYDLFLDNAYTENRLGTNIIHRIKKLVCDYKDYIKQIDSYQAFIHSDFRPANMLMNQNKDIYVVDFEYSGLGHTLADIGQFFRYEESFSKKDRALFEEVYNYHGLVKLPENWYDLAKFRELINPLQMIGGKMELPNKYQDLKHLIINTLDYFNY